MWPRDQTQAFRLVGRCFSLMNCLTSSILEMRTLRSKSLECLEVSGLLSVQEAHCTKLLYPTHPSQGNGLGLCVDHQSAEGSGGFSMRQD